MNKPDKAIIKLIDTALEEDQIQHDITTQALIQKDERAQARIIIKEPGIIAGCSLAEHVLHRVDSKLNVEILIKDGSKVTNGDVVMTVEGRAYSILRAERTVLNFLQHLSGIATGRPYPDFVHCKNTPFTSAGLIITACIWVTPFLSKTIT